MDNAPNTKPTRYDQIASGQERLRENGTATLSELFPELRRSTQTGVETLVATFPTPGARHSAQVLDLSYLTEAPNLQEPFARSFVVVSRSLKSITRDVAVVDLKNGWMAFIKANGLLSLQLDEVTSALLSRFLKWLQREVDGHPVWKPGTIKNKYRAVTRLFRALIRKEVPGFTVSPVLRIPPLADPRKSYVSRSALEEEAWVAVYKASLAEVIELRNSREHFESMREEAAIAFQGAARDENLEIRDDQDPAIDKHLLCFGALLDYVEKNRPSFTREHIGKYSRWLERSLYCDVKNSPVDQAQHFRDAMFRYCCPTSFQDLAPFVILFALYFGFNADVARELLITDFSFFNFLGVERLCLDPYKGRSRREQIRSFVKTSDIENPSELFRFVMAWTAPIRSEVHIADQSRLFIALVPGERARPVGISFNTWLFAKRNGLARFTLSNLRPTAIDIAHLVSGGDVRFGQVVANHRTKDLLGQAYTSPSAKRRDEDRLAEIGETRVRLVETKGKIDARRASEDGDDLAAATPGWTCLDPYSSPMPGQIDGRLCTAYGHCPICPLASLNTASPYCVGRVIQLRGNVIEAQLRLVAQRWLAVWAIALKKLDEHRIPSFSQEILDKASTLTLSPLPDLE